MFERVREGKGIKDLHSVSSREGIRTATQQQKISQPWDCEDVYEDENGGQSSKRVCLSQSISDEQSVSVGLISTEGNSVVGESGTNGEEYVGAILDDGDEQRIERGRQVSAV